MWRDTITRALIPIALTAVGAVIFQAGAYMFVTYPREGERFDEELRTQTDRFDLERQHQSDFRKAFDKAFQASRTRNDSLNTLAKRGLPSEPRALVKTHHEALQAILDINQDLGAVAGYSNVAHSEYKAAFVADLNSELEEWGVIRKCSILPLETDRQQLDFREELLSARARALGVSSAFLSALSDEGYILSSETLDRDRQLRDVKAKLHDRHRWLKIASGVFFFGLFAYGVLLTSLIGRKPPERTPSRILFE